MLSIKYTWTLRECGYARAKLRCNKYGAYSERPVPYLVENEASFPNIVWRTT
jgi:hypothetical protein